MEEPVPRELAPRRYQNYEGNGAAFETGDTDLIAAVSLTARTNVEDSADNILSITASKVETPAQRIVTLFFQCQFEVTSGSAVTGFITPVLLDETVRPDAEEKRYTFGHDGEGNGTGAMVVWVQVDGSIRVSSYVTKSGAAGNLQFMQIPITYTKQIS